MKTKYSYLCVLIILLFQSGCLYIARYDGPYHGKVVDAQTREPIEGVVVLGTWSVQHVNVAGGYHTYYDARETVTDKNGEFLIPGQGLRVMSGLEKMSVLIFKSGYQNIGSLAWDSIKIAYKDEIKWEGEMPIFPIKKLTMEERKKRLFGKESVPDEKQLLLIRELNRERVFIGLPPLQARAINQTKK